MKSPVRRKIAVVLLSILLCSLALGFSIFSNMLTSNEYPTPSMAITFYAQGVSNWCGPNVLQSDIQYINQYDDGADPTPTLVQIIPKATLWAYMRDNECQNFGGRDNVLPGNVGDGYTDV